MIILEIFLTVFLMMVVYMCMKECGVSNQSTIMSMTVALVANLFIFLLWFYEPIQKSGIKRYIGHPERVNIVIYKSESHGQIIDQDTTILFKPY